MSVNVAGVTAEMRQGLSWSRRCILNEKAERNHALVCEEVSNRNRRKSGRGGGRGVGGQVSDNVVSKTCILWLARTGLGHTGARCIYM